MTWRQRIDRACQALVRSGILRKHAGCTCPAPYLFVVTCLVADDYDPLGRPQASGPVLASALHHSSGRLIRRTACGILAAARHHQTERTPA